VLVHLIDAGAAVLEGRDLVGAYDSIRNELGSFETGLLDRREIVVLNKLDLVADRDVLATTEREFARRGIELQYVSGVTGEGLDALLRAVSTALDEVDAAEQEESQCGS